MTYGKYPDLSKVKKILVIKLRHHGDVLLTSPVFSFLSKSLPDVEIDAYIYKDTYPTLEGHPAINRFFLYDRGWKKLSFFKKMVREIKILINIRRQKYDMIINLTEGDRGNFVISLCQPRYSTGMSREGKKNVYTHLVKSCPNPRHTVEKQLDVLRCIGLFPSENERDLYFHIPKEDKGAASQLVNGMGEYIVIHAVSRWRFKCLPAQTMAFVVKHLVKQGKRVVFTSGPDKDEMEIVKNIVDMIPQENILDLSGKTTIKQLGAIIQRSQMLFCVDSLPLHMASALKTPVVVVFGPTSELNWGPWMHPLSRVVTKKVSCRPCFRDGCAGSKMSDCLFSLDPKVITKAIDSLMQEIS